MPESPAVTPKIANTSTVPAIEAAAGLPRARCNTETFRPRPLILRGTTPSPPAGAWPPGGIPRFPCGAVGVPTSRARAWPTGENLRLAGGAVGVPASRARRSPIRHQLAVLPGELLDLADIVLGHEAGAGADMAGSVHRGETVCLE